MTDPSVRLVAGLSVFSLAVALLLVWHWYHRAKLRRFIYRPLVSSDNERIFPRPKSLLDIVLDLGVSWESLNYLAVSLHWIPKKGSFSHKSLITAVGTTVAQEGTYSHFILATKAHLQGLSPTALPAIHDSTPGHGLASAGPATGSRQNDTNALRRQQLAALRVMLEALRDEAKSNAARTLGIVYRFDAVAAEVFRDFTRDANLRFAVSLDVKTNSAADLFLASGVLFAGIGGSVAAFGTAGQAFDGFVQGVHLSRTGMANDSFLDGMETFGEGTAWVGLGIVALGAIVKSAEWLRMRKFRKLQRDVKQQLEALYESFSSLGSQQWALPHAVMFALRIEVERLQHLKQSLGSRPMDERRTSNVTKVARIVTEETLKVYSRTLDRFRVQVEALARSVQGFASEGRRDLAGLHLYGNEQLIFDQLPNELLERLHTTYASLLKEAALFKRDNKPVST